MTRGSHENEIKLAMEDVRSARKVLRDAGFQVKRHRVFEANTVFDTARLELRKSSRLLRLRTAGKIATITYKGPPTASKHKSREELEVTVSNPRAAAQIMERLEYEPVFRYEKYRTEFEIPRRSGTAVLDETPIGIYLELEGTETWIDRTARRMGFKETDYITASYGRLYLEWCKRQKRQPGNMVFE